MRHPTLVVLAAGRSAAFSDKKQLTAVGPDGETLYDYTVYDALTCGFERIVFVVRPDNERDIRGAFEDRFGPSVLVSYLRQFRPLGTGHAVASLGGLVPGPFALVNANDLYGKEAVQRVADRLKQWAAEGPAPKTRACMVSYRLGDTLSESGGVSRAVYRPEAEGELEAVPDPGPEESGSRARRLLSRKRPDPEPAPAPVPRIVPAGFDEVLEIQGTPSGGVFGRRPDGSEARLDPEDRVSMNLWGFDPGIVEALMDGYNQWTFDLEPGEIGEYRLSSAMDRLVRDGHVDLETLAGPDGAWIGLFHRADVGPVQEAVAAAVERGDYPPSVKKAIRG